MKFFRHESSSWLEPDGDTCNHGLQHHIYPLFKGRVCRVWFLGGFFGFLLHKTDEIYYRKPRGWVLKIKGFFNNVAAYAVGPILIVHQVSCSGVPTFVCPFAANRLATNFIFFLARRTKNSQALNVVTNKNPMSDSYSFTTWWFQPIPNISVKIWIMKPPGWK